MFNELTLSLTIVLIMFKTTSHHDINFTVFNKTKSSLYLTWSLPVSVQFDSIIIKYTVVELGSSNDTKLAKNQTFCELRNLRAGSNISAQISIVNNSMVIISSQLSNLQPLDKVLVRNITPYNNELLVNFIPPSGYYDHVEIKCYCEEINIYEFRKAYYGNDSLSCEYLHGGYNYTIEIYSHKAGFERSPISFYSAKTNLDFVYFTVNEVLSGVLKINWDLDSAYDYLEIRINSLRSVNTSLIRLNQHDCLSGVYTINVTDVNTNEKTFSNLCGLTLYNISTTTYKNGYNSSTFYRYFRTGYGNVDCSSIKMKKKDDLTEISWDTPIFHSDYYFFYLYDLSESSLIEAKNLTNKTNSVNLIKKLNISRDYKIDILTIFNQFTSKKCSNQFTPLKCNKLKDSTVALKSAPFIEDVQVTLDNKFLTNDFDYFLVIVGIDVDCDQDKQFISNCYKALNFTREIFNTSNMTIILSTDSNCSENTLCNVRFQYGIDYYVMISLFGPCGVQNSKSLIINIPSIIKTSAAVIFLSTLSVLLVVTVLTNLIVNNYKEVKKFSAEIESG